MAGRCRSVSGLVGVTELRPVAVGDLGRLAWIPDVPECAVVGALNGAVIRAVRHLDLWRPLDQGPAFSFTRTTHELDRRGLGLLLVEELDHGLECIAKGACGGPDASGAMMSWDWVG